MRSGRLLLAALFISLPVLSGCGKAGQLERPEARPGEVRDIDAGSEPGRTLRTADPRDRSSEPLPPLAAPPARSQDPSEP